MKKAVSFLLALAVLCSLATVSFAADTAAELPIRWLDYDAVSWWSSELGLLQYDPHLGRGAGSGHHGAQGRKESAAGGPSL